MDFHSQNLVFSHRKSSVKEFVIHFVVSPKSGVIRPCPISISTETGLTWHISRRYVSLNYVEFLWVHPMPHTGIFASLVSTACNQLAIYKPLTWTVCVCFLCQTMVAAPGQMRHYRALSVFWQMACHIELLHKVCNVSKDELLFACSITEHNVKYDCRNSRSSSKKIFFWQSI